MSIVSSSLYSSSRCVLLTRPHLAGQVLTLTQDGRVIVGTLCGFDNVGSVILSSCVERIFSMDAGVEEVPLGLYILRGDAM